MDINKLIERQRAARTFEHRLGELTFTLIVPTPGEFRECIIEGSEQATQRNLVARALLAWQGVRVADVDPADEDANALLPLSPATVELLLSHCPSIQDALLVEIMRRYDERRRAREVTQGNSART